MNKIENYTQKWRALNRDHYNESQRVHSQNYWVNNKEKILAQKKTYYENCFKRERNRLFRILIK